jgi:hypothetical protein
MLQNLPQAAGGKTGTAQDPSAPHGGPDAWYDAVYPAQDPEVVVLCAVHGGGQGYYDCEPSVDELLQYFSANQAAIMSTTPVAPTGSMPQPELAGAAWPSPAIALTSHATAGVRSGSSTDPGDLTVGTAAAEASARRKRR